LFGCLGSSCLTGSTPPGTNTISNCEELQNIRDDVYADYSLINNIDCTETQTWDGNGFDVEALFIDKSSSNYNALFSKILDGAVIKDLNLKNVDITGINHNSALVAYNRGTIENCGVTGQITSTNQYAAGLVSHNYGTIINSYSEATIRSDSHHAGGLTAHNYDTISNSYASGDVSSGASYAAGISVHNNGHISDSYSTGNIYSPSYAAGLVANNQDNIVNSYAVGSVNGNDHLGGLVASGTASLVSNSYWDTESTGQSTSDGGGEAKTTTEMKQQATYSGWDFTTIWQIGSSYPTLR